MARKTVRKPKKKPRRAEAKRKVVRPAGFVLEHQDGDVSYAVRRGGYHWDGGRLSLSIQTLATAGGSFPEHFDVAVDGCPLRGGLVAQRIEVSTNPRDEPPNVHVYTTFHACEVSAELSIEVLAPTRIQVALRVECEDVVYYDERARPNVLAGACELDAVPRQELWLPG